QDKHTKNVAIIGGLLSGIVVCYAFVPSLKQFQNQLIKYLTIGSLSFILAVSSFVMLKSAPYDLPQYDKGMQEFLEMESMALEVYRLPPGVPEAHILYELKERGLYYWNKNFELVKGFDKLNLPKVVQQQNTLLKEYCRLRIESYELLIKAVDKGSNEFDEDIKNYDEKINAVIQEITQLQQDNAI